ncbi:hypothetical protein KKA66_03330 [Patescibacteria group bacterium]|nr:hypothetical protein [Patescibacteria group bacterium]
MNESILNVTNQAALAVSSKFSLITNTDPNWLYSSIAQCSAAIVGLTGALFITKIINQKSLIANIENNIKENKAKIHFLRESIKEKEEWISEIDEEDDLKEVKEFLKEIKTTIDLIHLPTVDELIQQAHENEDYRDINEQMLRDSYNEEYLESVRQYRRQHALLNFDIPDYTDLLINPQIAVQRGQRYREYSDEIYRTNVEIKYLNSLVKTEEDELKIASAGTESKKLLGFLAIFSAVGVFLPLFMLGLYPQTMYDWRFWVLGLTLASWIAILFYFVYEIKTLKNTDNNKIKK